MRWDRGIFNGSDVSEDPSMLLVRSQCFYDCYPYLGYLGISHHKKKVWEAEMKAAIKLAGPGKPYDMKARVARVMFIHVSHCGRLNSLL